MPLTGYFDFNLISVRLIRSAGQPPSAIITGINESAARLIGYPVASLINEPLKRVFKTKSGLGLEQHQPENCPYLGEIITQDQRSIPVLFSLSYAPVQQPELTDTVLFIQAVKADNEIFLMRRVVEQSASAVMVTDRNGRIEYVNPKFTELTGYSANELLGKNPKLFQSGGMTPEYYQAMWQELNNSGQWRGELQNQKKNGQTVWVYESISAIKNENDEVTHFVAVEEDITRRKNAESALSESEERFRQMAEISGEWLWEQDPNGFYLYSSNAVKQILGFDKTYILGKHYTEFLTIEDKKTQQSFAASRAPFYALVNHYQHRDGHQVFTESTGLPIFDAEGKLLKWRGVDRDITARLRSQEALIESEKRTRLIIESSINAIVIMDSYGIVIDWNHRAEQMFGWNRAEAIGQRLDELIIPVRFRHAHRQGMQTFLHTGTAPILNKQTEQIALRRDGSEFPVELSVSPLKLGNSYIFSGFIHDVSARKAAEEQIRQAHINLAIAQNEIRIAQQIQATLSPSAPIADDNFEVAGFCLTADKAGGDYFDYFFRTQNQLDIVIADVSGHSIGPALFMVETRSAIRAQANQSATPAETLAMLNRFLFNDLDQSDYFITLFYLQVDLALQQIKFANAGHPPPLLLSNSSNEFIALDAEGLILGIKKEVVFEEKIRPLNQGDLILFYTDGLIEAENADKEFFGLERIKDVLKQQSGANPQQIIHALKDALQRFCVDAVFADDITFMVFKAK